VDQARVIVLNGGSSSGKSAIVRQLQAILPQPWLHLGVDELVAALPPALRGIEPGTDPQPGPDSGPGGGSEPGPDSGPGAGIEFGPAGEVILGPEFQALELAWLSGIAAMVRAGAKVIIDDVFLGGAQSQQRVRDQLTGLPVLWVGVRCDPAVAAARERARGDRIPGMAKRQAELVHQGVHYDLELDTSRRDAAACAAVIAAHLHRSS
jgi:chloramphenicol 3-O phosphotransferase